MDVKFVVKDSEQHSSALVYGLPEQEMKDSHRFAVRYAGFKVGANEVRNVTSRIFQIRRDQVLSESHLPDYQIGGIPVCSYELPLNAEVFETIFKSVHLGVEICSTSGGTLGGLLATSPTRPILDQVKEVSVVEQLEKTREIVRVMGEASGDAGIVRGYCATVRQSYTWSGTIWVSLDENGADCDNLV
jgi:hypothetical protein